MESYVYSKALDALARSLWLILAGWVVLIPAVAGMLLMMAAERWKWDFPGEKLVNGSWPWLAIAGGLLNLYGKYSCFELSKPLELGRPLPGARHLTVALYSDLASVVVRLVGRSLQQIGPVKLLAFPLQVLGQVMFLLFLRKMAEVVHSHWLRWLLNVVLFSLGVSIVCGGVSIGLMLGKVALPSVSLGLGLGAVIFFIISTGGYMLALAQLAMAIGKLAKYLRESPGEDDCDEDEPAAEPA